MNPQTQLIAGAVEAIRFGSALDGWVFGPALYATHDGAATWHQVSLPGPVTDLAASDGQAFALVSNCPNATPECHTALPATATLWHAASNSDQWSEVPGVTGVGGGPGESIYLHGTSGWVVLDDVTTTDQTSELYYTANDATWHRIANPCSGATPGIGSIAAVASTVGFLCNGEGSAGSDRKTLVLSSDGGNTTRLGGMPPFEGDGGTLAALNPNTWVLANFSDASRFHRSTDGGATWTTTVTLNDGGEGFRDFGFTTASQGVAIHGWQTTSPQLIISRDGGTTWNPVAL